MSYDHEVHHRQSIRLKTHDYASGGVYFVTVCSHDREILFGAINDDLMQRNAMGSIVAECWIELAERHPWVFLDAWIMMPNHVHSVIVIQGADDSGNANDRIPLGRLIAEFKSNSTRTINLMRGSPGAPVWQRNYYERIIRNDRELDNIRDYIHANPANWRRDAYHV